MISRLKLCRLSIHRGKHTLYDEKFHDGVNIIHGDNGAGKSTIADFIYFALGGDLTDWRKVVREGDFVVAEIQARSSYLTIRRDVTTAHNQPMQIFFGSYDQAIAGDFRQFEAFPYRRPEGSGYSFSQILFRAIGIPEAISDGVSNVTMHQLLRVLYSDQLTPIQRIFQVESFDTWQIRQAVGHVLCGIGGYDLFALQLFLRNLTKEHDEVSAQLKGVVSIASGYGEKVLIEQITSAIEAKNAEREGLVIQAATLLEGAGQRAAAAEIDEVLKKQAKEYSVVRRKVAELDDRLKTLSFEIEDSDLFISHLGQSIIDFDDASATFSAFGAVRFEFCPSCFGPVKGHHCEGVEEESAAAQGCYLCGGDVRAERDETRALAVKLDLEMQLTESLALQAERQRELAQVEVEISAQRAKLRSIQRAGDINRLEYSTRFDVALSEINRKIGFIESELHQLRRRHDLATEIDALSKRKAALNEQITGIKNQISATENAQDSRKRIAYTKISTLTEGLIRKDLPEHSDFGDFKSFSFSFAADWMAIDGDKNRVGSASGMVILKNSFLFALFLASLSDKAFALPRFMLMDNIEDKGMVAERSWNFQRLIIEKCEESDVPHQIIFSTSKIAPELEGSKYVVGGKYTKVDQSLKLNKAK
ncbi:MULTISPECIES: AAA family ATPase [Asticcacaulis]|uniref:AAA family ATPase n=1 Tax=Asticcacaulis TaxID=76890 RepID=UPI001AE4E941|nr:MULTISPECIES: AAA family ATPase [Asticcacaulis]MBP2159328.1 hypothetical protein [Asticcacaulis solisilvae]MDR6800373.1 putative nucleic acid-binding Zn-ribbon protein [Asticcacaulis sp. BE141]